MKNRSVFSQVMILVFLLLICLVVTVAIAFFAGSHNAELFDFQNLNFSNMIPVLVLGGIITCIVVGISVIFVARSVFFRVREHLSDKKDGGNEK